MYICIYIYIYHMYIDIYKYHMYIYIYLDPPNAHRFLRALTNCRNAQLCH